MKINTVGLNLKITDGMKNAIEKKFTSLKKFFEDDTEISVKVTQKKIEVKLVVMFVYNNKLLKTTSRDNDFYIAVDKAVEVLKNQLKKQHSLKIKRETDQSQTIRTYFNETEDIDETPHIVKRKVLKLEPMSEDEAITEMEELSHNSFLFINSDLDGVISMIYRRNDGNFGILSQG